MSDTHTLSDLAAMKSKPYTYGGFEWSNVATISKDAWEKVPEPVPAPLKCPHCGRDFHTSPLTKRVADMVRNHRFDPAYKAAEDESPIECVGSDVYGPNRPPSMSITITGGGGGGGMGFSGGVVWMDELLTTTLNFATDALAGITGLQIPKWPTYSFTPWVTLYDGAYQPLTPPCPPELEVDVKFGPEHWPIASATDKWAPLFTYEEIEADLAKIHPHSWREPTPLPASPGIDVSALAEQFNDKHNPKQHNWNGVNK